MFFAIESFPSVVSYQVFKNDWIFINHDSFFGGEIFFTTLPFPILEEKSPIAKMIKQFFEREHFLIKLLRVQLCFRRFSPKFEALFLKSDYLFMNQSTVHR